MQTDSDQDKNYSTLNIFPINLTRSIGDIWTK